MGKKSFVYKSALIYILGLKILHKKNFDKRYRFMASFAKTGDTVLEPACGPAILEEYLVDGASYCGFDTNEIFIDYGLKKKRNVFLGNVLNKKDYRPADVVAVCDVLHHLKPSDRGHFVEHCYRSAKKTLIICEPFRRNGFFERLMLPYQKFLFSIIEKDGTNCPKLTEGYTRDELFSEINNGFGVIPSAAQRTINEIGDDLIAVYQKS